MQQIVPLVAAVVSLFVAASGCASRGPVYGALGGRRPPPVYDRTETGTASWYALHGRRTASGERFDASSYTAAHRRAPLGSRLRVTNLANGRSVVVRVNDRGPNVRGRLIDVSRAAADALGFRGKGTAKVRIEPAGGTARAARARVERADRTGGTTKARNRAERY